jgi:hypothetical protein
MRATLFGLIVVANVSWSILAAQSPSAPPLQESQGRSTAIGERFYLHGLSNTNDDVAVTVQGDLQLRSTAMACVNCHRRSGWGSTEGSITVPPVVGSVLFNPVTLGNPQMGLRSTGAGTRPAYDENALLKALRDGVDPAGRTLSVTMPRYAVSAADTSALSAYLRSLSADTPPGVTEGVVHLATIVSSDVEMQQRQAMLAVLREFVKTKNAGTRNEAARRERGSWDAKAQNETYRNWQLHEWSLHGPPSEWTAQLAELYARDPVYAIIGGLTGADWTPIHHFCERNHVPCIFPQVPGAPASATERDFYSLYFSRGVDLEAATLAHLLERERGIKRRSVVQVLRCGGPAEGAAARIAKMQSIGWTVRTRCLESAPAAHAWKPLLEGGPDVVVLWVGRADVAALATGDVDMSTIDRIFLSSSLLGDDLGGLSPALTAKSYLLHPFVPPHEFDRHVARAVTWLQRRGIDDADRRIAVNALFAATIMGDALAIPRTLLSREYLIERIEHMVGRSPHPSAYPAPRLGPQRRFASLGCYILKLPSEPSDVFATVGDWFVPEFRAKESK